MRLLAAACVLSALSTTQVNAATQVNAVGWGDGMYMAYFNINESGQISWTNPGGLTRNQILYPVTESFPNVYYASTTAGYADSPNAPDHTVVPAPWAGVLNPVANGGQDVPFSRWFGFSLDTGLQTFLGSDKALSIQLDSITFKGTSDAAENVSVYYYNNGTNDMNMASMYSSEDVAWSQLTASNYLVWDGNGFMNMMHPVVLSTDTFAADYTLTFTISVVNDITGSNLALVADSVTEVGGVTSYTFSYDMSSPGAVPEPSAALLILAGSAWLFFHRRSYRNREVSVC